MGLIFPRTPGALAGWIMLAFLFGIGIHALVFPRWHGSPLLWTALIVYPVILLGAQAPRRFKYALLIFLALVIGLWRVDVTPRPRPFSSHENRALSVWREAMTRRIESSLPRDEASLVAGILYGDDHFSRDKKAAFRRAGLTHIVAVSGSNVTIVVQYMAAVCLAAGLRRRQAFVATTFAIAVFSVFVGFGAPVLRAAFMGWLTLVGREAGRPVSVSRLLLVAATVLLAIDPWQALVDAGFALSFLAMWGLLAWAPIFERWFLFAPERFEFRKTLAATCAATLITAPYSAWMFGRLSLAGLVTNLLALPLVPFVMFWGVLAAFWGNLPGTALVSAPALGFSRAIFWIADLAAHMPANDLRIASSDLSTVLLIYAVLVYFWAKLRKKNDLSTTKGSVFIQ